MSTNVFFINVFSINVFQTELHFVISRRDLEFIFIPRYFRANLYSFSMFLLLVKKYAHTQTWELMKFNYQYRIRYKKYLSKNPGNFFGCIYFLLVKVTFMFVVLFRLFTNLTVEYCSEVKEKYSRILKVFDRLFCLQVTL